MDEFFESIVPFLVIIGIFFKFANKSKKKDAKTNKPGEKIGKAIREAVEEFVEEGKAAARPAAAPKPATMPAAETAVPAPDITWLLDEEDCEGVTPEHGHAEGASHADDTGCVGGSMAHDTHEGLRSGGSLGKIKAEGPGNLAAKSAPQAEPVQSSAEKARFSAKEMRRAIVTSEILREPIALRGRTARR